MAYCTPPKVRVRAAGHSLLQEASVACEERSEAFLRVPLKEQQLFFPSCLPSFLSACLQIFLLGYLTFSYTQLYKIYLIYHLENKSLPSHHEYIPLYYCVRTIFFSV